jgi:predicted CopG family antitoxin
MARTLPISDDVYERVSRAKMKGESFSDVIRRLLSRQKISDIPKIFDEDEWEKVEEAFGKQKELDAKRLKELL